MDRNKKQGQDTQRQHNTGAQPDKPGQDQQQGGQHPSQHPDRDQAEGSREQVRGSSEGGGISNRGLDREMDEQQDLPPRGRSRSDSDSPSGSSGSER